MITLLVACGSGSSQRPPLSGSGTSAPSPTTAPPTVIWIDNGFDTPGLPAIANDGSLVVIPEIHSDGGRGFPNLAIVVRDRHDAEQKRFVVLRVEEVNEMFAPHGQTPAFKARIADGNKFLAELHAAHDLRALSALETHSSALEPDAGNSASGGDLELAWNANRLTIQRASAVVHDAPTPASWLATDQPMCKGCAETCRYPAFLESVHGDPERRVALLSIAYAGTDTCAEPPSQHHVISW